MNPVSRQDLSFAIAQLMPRIIQGIQLEFLVKRSVTQTQFVVLVAVHSTGRCPMSLLAKNMHVSLPTMSGIIDRLVKAGYIRRLEDPQDRRQVVIELAAKGKQMIEQFQSVVASRWQEVLLALEPSEIDSFYQVVSKLKDSLQSQNKHHEK
jgi:DNA-binding MarR family transcriptional regulator